jgi:peptidoglycan/LPS O-acetylase OafA/YrhL
VFGIIVASHIQSFKQSLDKFKWIFPVLLIVFLAIATYERGTLFGVDITIPVETTAGSLYALCFIFTVLGYSNFNLPFANQLEKIGSRSFGIYLTHAPVQKYASKIIYHIAPWLLASQISFVLVISIFGLGIPWLLMEIVRRSPLSRYYQYIFG